MSILGLVKRRFSRPASGLRGDSRSTRRISIEPGLPTDLFIEAETETMLQYVLWTRRPGEDWYELGREETDTKRSHHWFFIPPDAAPREFAYSLGVWGCAADYWRVRVGVRQRECNSVPDAWAVRGSWTDTGILDNHGVGIDICSLPEASRIVLACPDRRAEADPTAAGIVFGKALRDTSDRQVGCVEQCHDAANL